MKNHIKSDASPRLKELTAISEIPNNFNPKPEAEIFLNFLSFIKENHPIIDIQDNEKIRSNLKFKIPPLQNAEKFKEFYEKSFLSKKKFTELIILKKLLNLEKTRNQ